MRYKYSDLFPYRSRKLGLADSKTSEEEKRSDIRLASLTIANLQEGDTLDFPKGSVVVTRVEDDAIHVEMTIGEAVSSEVITSQNLEESVLYRGLRSVMPKLHPDYCDPICTLIERDPSVFRTRAKDGWVISDVLCAMAGNVSYPLLSRQTEETPEPDSTETPDHAAGPQGAFDF